MRTTLDLDDELARTAKELAKQRGVTLSVLVEEGLRELLGVPERRPERVMLPVFSAKPMPGIDVTSTSPLLDKLEGPFAR